MIITLIGYMGSGKSSVGKILSRKLDFLFVDLDTAIEEVEAIPVATIFKEKGELYFRKKEREILKNILNRKENIVLSIGGGTPCFYGNIELINSLSKSYYLQASPTSLSARLETGKAKRPLIAHLKQTELPEFIAKHLFERNPFYQKAQHTINTNGESVSSVADRIISTL